MKCPESTAPHTGSRRVVAGGLEESRGGGCGVTADGHRAFFLVSKMFRNQMRAMFAQLYKDAKNH